MTKMIELKMPDGSAWHIPQRFVALHRARYYSERDSGTGDEIAATFKEEVEYAMEDDAEAQDWLQNNMNWSHVAVVAQHIHQPPATQAQYQKWFINAPVRTLDIKRVSWSKYFADEVDSTLTLSFDDADEYPAVMAIDADGFILTRDNIPAIVKVLQAMYSALDE